MSLSALLTQSRRLVIRATVLVALCLCGICWISSHGEDAPPAADESGPMPVTITLTDVSSGTVQIEFDAPEPGYYYPEYMLSLAGAGWIPMPEFEGFFTAGHNVFTIRLPDIDFKSLAIRMVQTPNEIRPTIFPKSPTQCPVDQTTCPEKSTECVPNAPTR